MELIEPTLGDVRGRIDALAADEGAYYLVCARTGMRPVPAADKRFERRAVARRAARETERYRAALRRYDPDLPHCDVIVCQDGVRTRPETAATYCHRVAAAVSASLSATGRGAVATDLTSGRRAVAGGVRDTAGRSPHLLERIGWRLSARLTPAEQADVLGRAATRLASDRSAALLDRLTATGLLGGYAQSPWSVDLDGDRRSVVIRLTEYALTPRDGRLPLVPVTIALLRAGDPSPSRLRVVDADGGWRLRFVQGDGVEPGSLATAPIHRED